jgi:hypothetical protein
MAMNRHARIALSECITYRIIEAVDKSVLLEIQDDLVRSVARTAPDQSSEANEEQAYRIFERAWRRCGQELIGEMVAAQAVFVPPS